MSRHIEQPTFENVGSDETMVRHPAFAQISASRVSGGAYLYGSDFQHQHYVTIRICESTLRRKLSNDWPMGSTMSGFIEVDLSEAQWAEFVSSMNVGSGVQCTLRRRENKEIPGLPAPQRRADQFRDEVRETMVDSLAHLEKLSEAIDVMSASEKQKNALRGHLRMARQELLSNIPFVEKQFAEHMETTVQKAKIEINAYATHAVMRAGVNALGGDGSEIPVLSLSGDQEQS
jgi:hypothetical protein